MALEGEGAAEELHVLDPLQEAGAVGVPFRQHSFHIAPVFAVDVASVEHAAFVDVAVVGAAGTD